MGKPDPTTDLPPGDLDAEATAVKIRWFGLLLGFIYANFGPVEADRLTLDAILMLGAGYTVLDTWFYRRRLVFLGDLPLLVSGMEAVFVGLLCYFERHLDSPFRFYYLLSVLCCALRHSVRVTVATFLLHCVSFTLVYFLIDGTLNGQFTVLMMLVILGWLTWASGSLGFVLRRASDRLTRLNAALRENQSLLESRIADRTRELQETQAQVMHQDKMAGFGLLAAGIAHEVGNPLTSISTIVQVLERHDPDAYTREKLALVAGQLTRIQGILRELTGFSRPANPERARFGVHDIVDEAMNIAKYYKGTKSRTIKVEVPRDLPSLVAVRDQLVQVVFNLVLNAIDATDKGGTIAVTASRADGGIALSVCDNGAGIGPNQVNRVFQPYFTTKKQGTGLGLFVSRRIVEAYGGKMTFESKPAAGATFRVWLPCEAGPADGRVDS